VKETGTIWVQFVRQDEVLARTGYLFTERRVDGRASRECRPRCRRRQAWATETATDNRPWLSPLPPHPRTQWAWWPRLRVDAGALPRASKITSRACARQGGSTQTGLPASHDGGGDSLSGAAAAPGLLLRRAGPMAIGPQPHTSSISNLDCKERLIAVCSGCLSSVRNGKSGTPGAQMREAQNQPAREKCDPRPSRGRGQRYYGTYPREQETQGTVGSSCGHEREVETSP